MNKHGTQLLLMGVKTGFPFQFSTNKESLYINSLSQSIDYGWETSSGQTENKSVTQASFDASKTNHDITIDGYIYINTKLGSGLISLKILKEIANRGET